MFQHDIGKKVGKSPVVFVGIAQSVIDHVADGTVFRKVAVYATDGPAIIFIFFLNNGTDQVGCMEILECQAFRNENVKLSGKCCRIACDPVETEHGKEIRSYAAGC